TSVYHFHPALLDACWQVFAATWEAPDDGKWATYMPVGIDAFRLFQRPAGRLWSYARLRQTGRETRSGDLMVFDESGRLVAEVQGLHVKRATPEALQRALQERPAGELADRPSLLTNGAAQPQDIKFAAPSWQEWLYEVEWRPQPHPQAAVSEGPLPAAPSQTVEQVQPLFTQLEAEHGLGVAAELLPQLEALSVTAVWQALAHLGWPLAPGQRFSVDTLAQASGVVPQQRSLLQRMMQMLAEEGLLRTQGDDWEVVQALAPELPGNLAVQLEELAGRYPIYAAELAVFD